MRRKVTHPILLGALLFFLWSCGTPNPFAPVIYSLAPPSGPPGTRVTITGDHFTINPGRVTLGTVSAEILSWSNTIVIAVVPNGVGSGSWTVDNGSFSTASTQTFITGTGTLPTIAPSLAPTATPTPAATPTPTPSPTASVGGATVTTFAGSGTAGFADGTGTSAQFSSPTGIGINSGGVIFVADSSNHRVRTITSTGVVTTAAGSGTAGFADGTGTSTQFSFPIGVAFDGTGNLVIADSSNHRIRKVSGTNVVTTFAGSGTAGFADGTGATAQFNFPADVINDSAGNIYVADSSNNRIRKITLAGVVTTLAGSGTAGFAEGTGASAQFNQPIGLALIGTNLIVADSANNRLRLVDISTGAVTTLAGSSAAGSVNGSGGAATFNTPRGLAVDTVDNIYVADSGNNLIRKVTALGLVTTVAGSGSAGFTDGSSTAAQFNQPFSIDFFSGALFVSDTGNNRLRRITGF